MWNYCLDLLVNYSIHKPSINRKGVIIQPKKIKFCTKAILLNLMLTLSLAKLDMIGARLGSNGLIFSDDIPVDIQLLTLLLLSHVSKLSIGGKTEKF